MNKKKFLIGTGILLLGEYISLSPNLMTSLLGFGFIFLGLSNIFNSFKYIQVEKKMKNVWCPYCEHRKAELYIFTAQGKIGKGYVWNCKNCKKEGGDTLGI